LYESLHIFRYLPLTTLLLVAIYSAHILHLVCTSSASNLHLICTYPPCWRIIFTPPHFLDACRCKCIASRKMPVHPVSEFRLYQRTIRGPIDMTPRNAMSSNHLISVQGPASEDVPAIQTASAALLHFAAEVAVHPNMLESEHSATAENWLA
jgi:hypothetical protein